MMLRLERQVYKTLRYFVYENNTAYIRQRIVDALDPIMKSAWQAGNGGINRYKIICDESINTPNVIDNNELKVAIGIVPNKSAEFIMVDFILGNQSATWEELF
jgi:phage tail sheath protein FI